MSWLDNIWLIKRSLICLSSYCKRFCYPCTILCHPEDGCERNGIWFGGFERPKDGYERMEYDFERPEDGSERKEDGLRDQKMVMREWNMVLRDQRMIGYDTNGRWFE